MPDRGGPKVFTIPVHRNFADALVNGLMAQFGRDRMTLARGTILVPNNRAVRAITDAFVRRAEPGLLLPRLVAVGDVGGDSMGVALDPASGDPVPGAVDPMVRRFIMARLVQQARAEMRSPVDASEALRLATELAAMRRGCVWPISRAFCPGLACIAPRPSCRQILGSCVVLPEPVSPQTITT